ncbi:MAG: tetratricopeptide repeat protein [Microcoleaceae cyanobacterium]
MIQRQYQTTKVGTSSNLIEAIAVQYRGHHLLRILSCVLLFPSVSLMLTQPTKAVTPIWVQVNQSPLNSEIQDAVQTEIDRAYRRTFAALNLLLVVLLVLPTASAIIALFWLSKLGEKVAIAQAEIESLQVDASFQIEGLIEETKTILHQLLEKNTLAEETLKKLESKSKTNQNISSNVVTIPQTQLVKDYAKQGEKLFLERNYQEALNTYAKALEIKESLPEVWNNRGVILTKLQRYAEAIDSYDKAIKIHSDYPDAWNNRGVALGKLKEYEKAVDSYDHAVELKPDYADAWNNRGFALAQLKKYDEAIQSYQQATALKPNFYLVWYNQARCYSLQNKPDLAFESLKKAIEIKPQVVRKLVKKESDFDRLKADRRFQELITE